MIEGIDYIIEDGLLVFTKEYHLKRGFCCKNGCKHCPYPIQNKMDNVNPDATEMDNN